VLLLLLLLLLWVLSTMRQAAAMTVSGWAAAASKQPQVIAPCNGDSERVVFGSCCSCSSTAAVQIVRPRQLCKTVLAVGQDVSEQNDGVANYPVPACLYKGSQDVAHSLQQWFSSR
jgi:hypothetical protein